MTVHVEASGVGFALQELLGAPSISYIQKPGPRDEDGLVAAVTSGCLTAPGAVGHASTD